MVLGSPREGLSQSFTEGPSTAVPVGSLPPSLSVERSMVNAAKVIQCASLTDTHVAAVAAVGVVGLLVNARTSAVIHVQGVP